jgi:hypothetical protein
MLDPQESLIVVLAAFSIVALTFSALDFAVSFIEARRADRLATPVRRARR